MIHQKRGHLAFTSRGLCMTYCGPCVHNRLSIIMSVAETCLVKMSFGEAEAPQFKKFISQAEINEQKKKRQEEWDKVRKPDEPLGYTLSTTSS